MMTIRPGIRTAAAISDLDNDGFKEMIVGNFSGGLTYYKGIDAPPVSGLNEHQIEGPVIRIFPNPTGDFLFCLVSGNPAFETCNFEIFDISERIVKRGTLNMNTRQSIPVKGLNPGVYLLRIMSPDGKFRPATERFVKY